MRSEPSRRLYGGQAAMQSKTIAGTAFRGLAAVSSTRARPALIFLVSAFVIVAITAAPALPSRYSEAMQASPSKDASPLRLPLPYSAAAPRSSEETSDVAARRFTGRVGANL